jgi:hypothetical protein
MRFEKRFEDSHGGEWPLPRIPYYPAERLGAFYCVVAGKSEALSTFFSLWMNRLSALAWEYKLQVLWSLVLISSSPQTVDLVHDVN